MVKNIVKKEDYQEIRPAYIRNGIQYYELNINPVEINGEIVCLSDIYNHIPTDADKITLYEKYLNLCKKVKLNEIDHYDTSENVNAFYVNGEFMWFDRVTRGDIAYGIDKEIEAGKTETILWADPIKGQKFVLSCELAKLLLRNIEIYAKQCFNQTAEHKYAITQLTTIEDVENYDYTQGYPEPLLFEL